MPETVGAQIAAFLDHLTVERGLARNTLLAYGRDLARYAEFCAARGIADLAAVTPSDVEAFARELSGGQHLAPASVTRTLVAVRSLHRFAATEGRTPSDPAADVDLPSVGRRLPKALSIADTQALLDGIDTSDPAGLRDKALLELLYGTGARISEVVSLDVDDITRVLLSADESTGLRLLGKGGKERVVPVGTFARAALSRWLGAGRAAFLRGPSPGPALFLNARGGRLSRQSAWAILKDRAAAAGLTAEVSPHTLRHSYATHLLDGGADVRVVQELLGHASVTTTQLYTLVTVDHLREVFASSHPRAY
ncbi:site-specific tyrosine recombinase XerD [Propionicicella superfundia]|uniref:site-specific tyrosine recombinase XerD n=1 Tax=Propionicicella superfundia TaxID=348582 RepID=UPI0004211F5A|nr:site-specific tyrosine recombinase XerD [Propionicicella superfundia]